MSVFSGPEIVNDNCVYHHDMGNTQKSWKGAPTTNLATTQTLVNHSLVTLPTFSDAPERGEGWKKAIVTATSTNFRMLKMDAFNVAANSTTTYSIEFECSNPEVYLNIDGTGFGGGAWTKIGDTRYSRTVTTATAGSAYLFVNSNNLSASVNYVIYYKEHQIESGSFATPYVASARSTTQAIVDLTNTNTITSNSLTYASDNTFSFNGSSNYINVTNISSIRPPTELTIEYVIKGLGGTWSPIFGFGNGSGTSAYTTGNYLTWTDAGSTLSGLCRINNSGVIEYRQTSGGTLSNTVFTHVCFTMKIGDAIRSYINGVANGTPTTLPAGGVFHYPDTSSPYQIGGLGSVWFNGNIPLVKLYNRALTAQEVQQNFNALRSRYAL